MPEDWSREEVEAVVADYLDMLWEERRGEEVNKAEHNRNLRKILTRRSQGSLEYKHQNISAVLRELNHPWIEGYKPASNYQALLRGVVIERLSEFSLLEDLIEAQVAAEFSLPNLSVDILSILRNAPKGDREPYALSLNETAERIQARAGIKRDYLEIEARNRSLGKAGEELIIRFEQQRLWQAGQKTLSDRVELVSQTKGDGLGYDVLSFEENGRERMIEVKTTQFGDRTPFFASRTEVEVSSELDAQYHVYRLFHFNKAPKLFTLAGSLRNSCSLEPVTFSALPA